MTQEVKTTAKQPKHDKALLGHFVLFLVLTVISVLPPQSEQTPAFILLGHFVYQWLKLTSKRITSNPPT